MDLIISPNGYSDWKRKVLDDQDDLQDELSNGPTLEAQL